MAFAHVLERLKERIEVKKRPRQFGGRGKQGAARLVEALRAYLVDHDGICVDCEDMRGVCCRAPCDVDSLRPYAAFLRTDPSKPHYFRVRHLVAVVWLLLRVVPSASLRKLVVPFEGCLDMKRVPFPPPVLPRLTGV